MDTLALLRADSSAVCQKHFAVRETLIEQFGFFFMVFVGVRFSVFA